MNQWKFGNAIFSPLPEELKEYTGFIYEIVSKIDGRRYIGKKLFWFKKGKRKVESDWKTYHGSCNELSEDIKKHGTDNFERYIIRLCKTRFEWSYYEMVYQVQYNVLLDAKYYNQLIRVRLHAPKKEVNTLACKTKGKKKK